jgi:hypothetical protein
MVINQRGGDANGKTDAKPGGLAFDEEVNVTMTVARKRACAEKHDNADNEQAKHSQK